MSQTILAESAGISRSTLNMIEGGLASDMLVSTLERLCEALGVTADALLGYNGVKLIRSHKLHALVRDGAVSGEQGPRQCGTCGKRIPPRALHLPGDCMLEMSVMRGATDARIGAVFGLSTRAVEAVLREEHEARRRG